MKKLLFVFLFSAGNLFAQKDIHIIPEPVSLTRNPGVFSLTPDVRISISATNPDLVRLGRFLSETLEKPTGYKIAVSDEKLIKTKRIIELKIDQTTFKVIGQEEGYSLEVSPQKVTVKAHTPAGIFYGIQSILQLLPKEIEANSPQKVAWKIPGVSISDYPRFGWRGAMLDVSRHFFPKEYVKKFIDQLARYKMNTFHWHLTDDQGWRIEIKSYPRLTSIGAWRVPRVGNWWDREPAQPEEAATYGGFYTHEDIREIVKYAQERNIQILPEIDVPGHSMAILAAYPEFSCEGGTFQVNAGSKFYKETENALCPSNEKVYEFLDKVFEEIAELFPHPYIHMGGDECYRGFWEKSAACQNLMKREHLKSSEELQSYFVKKVEKIIQSKGKKLIGWDEILEGGLAPDATVMSWRGTKGGIEAARQGHKVIMTPSEYVYLDLYQGDPAAEPVTYGMCRLKKSYSFEPVPGGVNEELVLGGQGNLWTESVPNTRHLEYMLYPRLLALSEVYWSQKSNKNWNHFVEKVENHFERLDEAEINYSRSAFDAIIRTLKDENDNIKIDMSTEVEGLDIHYTFDGTNPDSFYPKYQGRALDIPKNATVLKAVTYHNGKRIGKIITLTMQELRDRVGKYQFVTQYVDE